MKVNIVYCVPAYISSHICENVVPDIWLKILSASQIAAFLNKQCL